MGWRPDMARVQVMGILNVTPDSFSDGGQFQRLDEVLYHVEQMMRDGAAIVDVGGESTRPGAQEVPVQVELERVLPVIEGIRQRFEIPVSIDTSKPDVMQQAVAAGAELINDVRALQEPGALEVCARLQVPVCLMHMQGLPRTMQQSPHYTDVVTDIMQFFRERISACTKAGMAHDKLILDPGFGFGKNLRHNIELLCKLDTFSQLNLPILIGVSRKSMIGALLDNRPVTERLQGSVAAAVVAAMKGAHIVRVHDVKATVDAMKIINALNKCQ